MYAGRNADDTDDDMIFYGMNAYWEPLEMRLPSLPESYHWKLVVNTFCEYQDGADFEAQTTGRSDTCACSGTFYGNFTGRT